MQLNKETQKYQIISILRTKGEIDKFIQRIHQPECPDHFPNQSVPGQGACIEAS
jgi:hypothetical protein